jgi:glycosyltransferase involved in cell wall biosynthesis
VSQAKAPEEAGGAPATVPLVSIGLPVLNGERYLADAVDSLLAQTFTDFELILCDNASTDRTAEICQGYAARDPRVRYVRNPRTISGGENHNLTLSLARGRYFRWAGYDDLVAPTFLERTVAVLEADPRVVVAHPWTITIDEHGNELERIRRDRRADLSQAQRFADIAKPVTGCEEQYGLIRRDALVRTGGLHAYTDADRTMLAHLCLLGAFEEVPEYLFFRRVHAAQSTMTYSEWRERMRWWGGKPTDLPHWRQLGHYLSVIAEAPVPVGTKLRCLASMVVWVGSYRKWRSLGKDLVVALRGLAGRVRPAAAGRSGRWGRAPR